MGYTIYVLDEVIFDKSQKKFDCGERPYFYFKNKNFRLNDVLEDQFSFSCNSLKIEFDKKNYEEYMGANVDDSPENFDAYALEYQPTRYPHEDLYTFYGINF